MKKTIFVGLLTLIAMSAQARQLYWTGHANVYGYDPEGCESQALSDARDGVINSCVRDYGYSYGTCYYAPVVQTEAIQCPYYDRYYNQTSCSFRVYIQVP